MKSILCRSLMIALVRMLSSARVVLGPGVFNVISDTEVTATVPSGVSSPAEISLKTLGGPANARGNFTVQ